MNNPLLYQINTRILLQERGAELGRRATLDDVPDSLLDWLADQGFEWVWFLGMWQTGNVARQVSMTNPSLRSSYAHELPDFTDADICGSPFAVQSYTANADFGGDQALARLRSRMSRRGLRLMLDFVVNHCAPDHSWASEHPEYFIRGSEEDLAREPQNYTRFRAGGKDVILAYGRDPYFAGWPDTLQLNYRHRGCRQAMMEEILSIAERCDGIRCDMAMLVQPQVFMRTWGDRALPADGSPPDDSPFWSWAISRVKEKRPDFLFTAEVYWDMEWELQQAGFDFTYDKSFYDRLRHGWGKPVREHLLAADSYQEHSLRFLENHDEPRAALEFPPEMHQAAAVITFFVRGLRFFHEGQFEGRKVHASMHLSRRPIEPHNEEIHKFYLQLLDCLKHPAFHSGQWRLLECRPAWEGNPTWEQFVAFSWDGGGENFMIVVNYAPTQGQCYVGLGETGHVGRQMALSDMLSGVSYERDGTDLASRGLYVDMPPYGRHVFALEQVARQAVTVS